MGRNNPVLLLRAAQEKIRDLESKVWVMKGFTLQQALDIAMIALHEEFGFGPVYNARFGKAFRDAFVQYAELCVSDSKDDEEIVYTKGVLDRQLRAACGDDILPFDERYAQDRLYFRDSREQWRDGDNE